jgi:hypothetical protein
MFCRAHGRRYRPRGKIGAASPDVVTAQRPRAFLDGGGASYSMPIHRSNFRIRSCACAQSQLGWRAGQHWSTQNLCRPLRRRDASFGVFNTDGLRAAVEQPLYRNALVLVAWEHALIETIARALLAAHGGDAALVPKWHGDDFDSIYVVTITSTGDAATATFAHRREGLDGQPDTCPH